VALVNASDVVAPHRTPNGVTFSQKFADDVGANETRGTSNLPADNQSGLSPLEVGKRVTYKNNSHDEESKRMISE